MINLIKFLNLYFVTILEHVSNKKNYIKKVTKKIITSLPPYNKIIIKKNE